MRALLVSNMWPTAAQPALGSFVRDQVEALRRRGDVELDLVTFPPGGPNYLKAMPGLARRRGYDVAHAHFGLTALPALAAGATVRGVTLHGTDLVAPRSRALTLRLLPRYDLVAVPSAHAEALLPAAEARRAKVLPTGIDLSTFTAVGRREARRALGLDPDEPFVLFPYDRARAVKRYDLAQAAAGAHRLQTLGHEPRERMRLWLSAASIVLCPADWETFGMAAVEAVACGTSVLATPTGVHLEVLGPIGWCECLAFEPQRWREVVDAAIARDEQHADGPLHAERWSSDEMAGRLVAAWAEALDRRRAEHR